MLLLLIFLLVLIFDVILWKSLGEMILFIAGSLMLFDGLILMLVIAIGLTL